MKNLIFDYNNFFGSGHFLIHQIWKNRLKNSRSQKSCCNQKSVFSCKSTTQGNFWNPFILVWYFYDFWPELLVPLNWATIRTFYIFSTANEKCMVEGWLLTKQSPEATVALILVENEVFRIKRHFEKTSFPCSQLQNWSFYQAIFCSSDWPYVFYRTWERYLNWRKICISFQQTRLLEQWHLAY